MYMLSIYVHTYVIVCPYLYIYVYIHKQQGNEWRETPISHQYLNLKLNKINQIIDLILSLWIQNYRSIKVNFKLIILQ